MRYDSFRPPCWTDASSANSDLSVHRSRAPEPASRDFRAGSGTKLRSRPSARLATEGAPITRSSTVSTRSAPLRPPEAGSNHGEERPADEASHVRSIGRRVVDTTEESLGVDGEVQDR